METGRPVCICANRIPASCLAGAYEHQQRDHINAAVMAGPRQREAAVQLAKARKGVIIHLQRDAAMVHQSGRRPPVQRGQLLAVEAPYVLVGLLDPRLQLLRRFGVLLFLPQFFSLLVLRALFFFTPPTSF